MRGVWERVRWDVRRLYYQLKKAVLLRRLGERWEDRGGIERRVYPDYRTYVEHQKTKLDAFRFRSIVAHDQRFRTALGERLAALPLDLEGRRVVCLGARQGGEVRAFRGRGAFAVGVDLNPGPGNQHVLPADFHDLPFARASVDCVYTNSLDHAFDLDRVLGEAGRVLAAEGILIVEANVAGEEGGARAGRYEATVWPHAGALLARLREHGFRSFHEATFEVPWSGRCYVLRRGTESAAPPFAGAAEGT